MLLGQSAKTNQVQETIFFRGSSFGALYIASRLLLKDGEIDLQIELGGDSTDGYEQLHIRPLLLAQLYRAIFGAQFFWY